MAVAQAAPDPAEAVKSSYRPHWDGLRAVAVYLVVAYHAGSSRLAGGFIGVDVFFVLSGYLVTQLLLRDIVGRGAIRFGRFYARRFRRLLPAAFVALLATAAVFAVIASSSELLDVTGAFRAAFLYSTNWYFIRYSASYFGTGVATNPVLHFWSLAVEEQFYLVWPLALGGLFALTRRFGKHQRRSVRIVVGVVLLMSVARALSLRTSNPDWAYYGSDARAYQLLAGASIALAPSLAFAARYRRVLRAITAACLLAVLVFASSWIHLDPIERGISIAVIVSVLIIAIEGAEAGVARRVLSLKPIVYLGKISYGTYLWHWIVILVLLKKSNLGTGARFAVASVVATGLASLSYQLLEQPVRESRFLDRYRIPVIASGLAISLVGALVLIPAIVDRGPTSVSAPAVATVGFTPVPKGINGTGALAQARREGGPFVNCLGKPVDTCTIVRGTGRHILLVGDSHAWTLIPTFTEIARAENLTLSVAVRGVCLWQRGLYRATIPGLVATTGPKGCAAEKEDVYKRVIPTLHPDVVVLSEAIYESGAQPFVDVDGHPRTVSEAQLEQATNDSVSSILASGSRALIVEPVPQTSRDLLTCLSTAKFVEDCREIVSDRPSALESFYRTLAAQNPKVSDLDIDRVTCPYLPICDPIVGGKIVRWDTGHLTAAFAKSIAPTIDEDLKQQGLIPRARA